uniref:Exostosin GT47 domain-containing protein n=1 Tax=Kalanchoe fedtschenkoi TaxID=63787 RepID=A0A7N0V392_KALFE
MLNMGLNQMKRICVWVNGRTPLVRAQPESTNLRLGAPPRMATSLILHLLFPLLLFASPSLQAHHRNSPYVSHLTFLPNHQKMLHTFKIYIYPHNPATTTFTEPAESAFYSTLLTSPFLTSDPDGAHLFFIPSIFSALSSRSISRHIRNIRSTAPYWNRTLGADHFYLHSTGLGYESDRNLVELKKNALQISCFPTKHGRFVPHKDITLPPLNPTHPTPPSSKLVNDLLNDPEILVDASPEVLLAGRLKQHKYCLLFYEDGSVAMVGEALRHGCVPVVVAASGVQDLPMMGVLRWAEMAVFVGGGVSGEEVRRVLREVGSGGGHERMRGLGVAAAKHFTWGDGFEEQYDAFNSVMYQLWVRRHTIRYARVEVA